MKPLRTGPRLMVRLGILRMMHAGLDRTETAIALRGMRRKFGRQWTRDYLTDTVNRWVGEARPR